MSGLGNPRGIFGIHSFTPYSRTDGMPYGTLKVVNSASIDFKGTTAALTGGSNKHPWAVEEGKITSQLGLKFGEYPDFVFTLFMGMTPTENGADASGAVSTLTNKNGTSVMNATTGIASVGATSGSESDLKFTKYVVKAITATTVNVYAMSDVDFQRGTSETFQDSTLKLVAANVSITTGAASDISGFGFTLTGGSGTIGMTAGDTATFSVKPKNTANASGVIGRNGTTFPEFGAIVMAQKRGTGEMAEFDCYRCKGEGMPFGMDEGKFSQADVKVTLMYDADLDGVAGFRFVTPTIPN